MPTAQVFGPFNQGINWGQTDYCHLFNDAGKKIRKPHHIVHKFHAGTHWGRPIDVGWLAGAKEVHCQVSAEVESIRVSFDDGICSDTTKNATFGIICQLFADKSGMVLIGTVMYGHIDEFSRATPRLYTKADQNFNLGGWIIGTAAADCACSCASGIHVHMQVMGKTNALDAKQKTYACSERIHRGTPLYTFSF